MNSEERIRYFDIAKGLYMIAIVAGHMENSPINHMWICHFRCYTMFF